MPKKSKKLFNKIKKGLLPQIAKNHQKRHGQEIIYLVNEGFYDNKGQVKDNAKINNFFHTTFDLNLENLPNNLFFRFSRMFLQTKSQHTPETDKKLEELGNAMIQSLNIEDKDNLSETPAGYTFLGQFIDHDMSFDSQKQIPDGLGNLALLRSKRSPTLELDSLYGTHFDTEKNIFFDKELYQADEIHFKIGPTISDSNLNQEIPNDLPRKGGDDTATKRKAVIGDERNDENLGIAQMHVAFLRFHNSVVDEIKDKVSGDKLFEEARKIVIKHYQWIILYDFLPKIIDEKILKEVIANKELISWLPDNEAPFIPVEFSGATFRLGHSMVRHAYEWNKVFQSPNQNGNHFNLFTFTGNSNMGGENRLISSWVIDWTRFFDFTEYGFPPIEGKFNKSRKIDTSLVDHLKSLREFVLINEQSNLAIRNLLRGRYLGLPTGQEVVYAMREKLTDKRLLTAEELTEGNHRTILDSDELKEKTPLWYYILKEAEIIGEGKRLGTVGSYIVAETFVKLIQHSGISIFQDNWNPQVDKLIDSKNFGMPEMIKFADSKIPLINPLGN